MTKAGWVLLSVMLCAVMARPQRSQRPADVGACKVIDSYFGPITCPNGASCGSYYTFQTEECYIDNEEYCQYLVGMSICCGKYPNYAPNGDMCLMADVRDPRVRPRILELAQESEILVPTCSGAYVPAGIAFRTGKGMDHGGF